LTRVIHFAVSGNSTRLSIIERPGNTRPNWPMKAGNSQAEWLDIGVTLRGQLFRFAHCSNLGVTFNAYFLALIDGSERGRSGDARSRRQSRRLRSLLVHRLAPYVRSRKTL